MFEHGIHPGESRTAGHTRGCVEISEKERVEEVSSIPSIRYQHGRELPSQKSYAVAVILSSIFGFIGIQHFYLGRFAEGILDLGLSLGWIGCLFMGEPAWAGLLALTDFGHSFAVTIRLFTGNFRDGQGRRVCYPGQKVDLEPIENCQ